MLPRKWISRGLRWYVQAEVMCWKEERQGAVAEEEESLVAELGMC